MAVGYIGYKIFGKVDAVKGVGCVGTKFYHINNFPIWPTGTFFVTEQYAGGFRGIRIPLSLKSVVAGYVRTYSVLWGVLIGGMAVLNFVDPPHDGYGFAIISIAAWTLFILFNTLGFFKHASPERAKQLMELAGSSAKCPSGTGVSA